MAMLEDATAEVSARLTVIEFALQTIYANQLASTDRETAERVKRQLIEGLSVGWERPDDEWRQQISDRSEELMEDFARKIGDREEAFRSQLAPRP